MTLLTHTRTHRSLTMAQLLDKLIVQAKAEAREGLRKLILSYNGLAGLYILQEEVGRLCLASVP